MEYHLLNTSEWKKKANVIVEGAKFTAPQDFVTLVHLTQSIYSRIYYHKDRVTAADERLPVTITITAAFWCIVCFTRHPSRPVMLADIGWNIPTDLEPTDFISTAVSEHLKDTPSTAAASLCLAPLASSLILHVPTNPQSGGVTDIIWENQPGDPATWTLFLMDSRDAFGLKAILGRFIDPTPEHLTGITLPVLAPGDYYVLKAVNSTWVDFPYAWSPKFAISA
ncbi:hypothetical protein BDZ94DRAFT_1308272 [Collybia nuda]|uniref:Uncharacterized protein n=1 Tax=Collybia nuda TaxID=64659 RepID=A0A9P5Y9Y8_9AGAR|nr:hypothetical protein BDZ94DRAFT_1308272 [Collybia nuda]